MSQYEDHVFQALFGRRSIRAYRDDRQVAQADIVKLLQAAMAAPSACNIQPWEFVVVTEPEPLSRVKATTGSNGQYNAPVAIVVCGVSALIPWPGDDGTADCAAAIENLLTAATAMGLGTVWIGGFDRAALRQALDIPESITPVGMVYLGYPAEEKEPRTQYLAEAVHWQRYDSTRQPERRPGSLVGGKA